MPQITLEYTANATCRSDFPSVFRRLHQTLADVGGIDIKNCKSRAIERGEFFVGDGSGGGFVHLDVKILDGRPIELKERIGRSLLEVLEVEYAPEEQKEPLQLTVEVHDIIRTEYFKYSAGSVSQKPV